MGSNCNGFFAFLGGAIVGAVAGVLLAPERGKVMRLRVRRALQERGLFLDEDQLDVLLSRVTVSEEEV